MQSPRSQETSFASPGSGIAGGSKLTPEMCKAIKRQEVTTAVDYWKVGHNGIASHVHDKRPTYSRVTQINLDFPGAFLPNVSQQQQQQQQPQQHQKPKRKDSANLVLNRSRTSVNMPSIFQPKVRLDKVTPIKKPMSDLTCMQLADTLFASKSSGFAGFFNFTIPKSSYGEIFGTDSECNDVSSDTSKTSTGHHGKHHGDPRVKYRTFQPDEQQRDGHYSPTSPVFQSRWNELFGEKKDIRPSKSILKNGGGGKEGENVVYADTQSRETSTVIRSPSTSPTTRYHSGHIKLDLIHPVMRKHDSPRQLHVDARQQPEVDLKITGVVSDFSARKRSVRFNADHEIREYKPCEPVSYS